MDEYCRLCKRIGNFKTCDLCGGCSKSCCKLVKRIYDFGELNECVECRKYYKTSKLNQVQCVKNSYSRPVKLP